jgi:hypothetical protein
VKLVRDENESDDLRDFLDTADAGLATSRVGIVELHRAARRGGASADRAGAISGTLEVIELDAKIEGIAVALAPELRTLDAIHLASALASREALSGFVCYDHRLAEAAEREGLPVVAPGAP